LCAYVLVLRYLYSFPTRRSSDLCGICDKCRWCIRPLLMLTQLKKLLQLNAAPPSTSPLTRLECFGTRTLNNNLYVFNKSILITLDRKSTRLNSSHVSISYAVFCL